MKHKTWFRLVLKAIGVLMLCLGLPELLGLVALVSYVLQRDDQAFMMAQIGDILAWQVPQLVSSMLQSAAGLYLQFGGNWIVNKAIPSNRPYCPNCDYPLRSGHGVHCPECGVPLARDAQVRDDDEPA